MLFQVLGCHTLKPESLPGRLSIAKRYRRQVLCVRVGVTVGRVCDHRVNPFDRRQNLPAIPQDQPTVPDDFLSQAFLLSSLSRAPCVAVIAAVSVGQLLVAGYPSSVAL